MAKNLGYKKYHIVNPIVKKHMADKEKELGRKLDKKERHEFIKKDQKELRRKMRWGVFVVGLAAVGITVGAKKMLPEPKDNPKAYEQSIDDNQSKSKEEEYRESIKHNVESVDINNKENIGKEIAEKYNAEYNADLSEKDIGYIKITPEFLRVDINGNYSLGKKDPYNFDLVVYDEYIGDVYAIVDKREQKIISSVGVEYNSSIPDRIINIDVQETSAGDKRYVKSDKTINLIENNKEKENKEIYERIKKAYNERVEELERE